MPDTHLPPPGWKAVEPLCGRSTDAGILCDRAEGHLGGCTWELRDLGYLAGLRNMKSGVSTFDMDLPGFDQDTVRKLIRFADGMTSHAMQRLGYTEEDLKCKT